jgi:hypothetical protein
MPAPELSKSSLSNAIAAVKDHGCTAARVNFNTDCGFDSILSEVLENHEPRDTHTLRRNTAFHSLS